MDRITRNIVLLLAAAAFVVLWSVSAAANTETDEEYENLLKANPEMKARVTEIDAALEKDEELEEGFLAL